MSEIWFEREGTRLFAVEEGAGRPVIMLQGGLANHLSAIRLVSSLAPASRVIAPDLRGSGRSWDSRPLSWDLLADDVIGLMDHLAIERAVIGGVSSGSGVAVRAALRYPKRFEGLIVVSPVNGGEAHGLSPEQVATFKRMDEVGSRAVAEGVRVLRPLYENLPEPIRERAFAMIDGFDPGSVAATTRFLVSGAQPFASAAELGQISMPVVVVPGTDALHPARVSAFYSVHLPRCRIDLYPSAIEDFCQRLLTSKA